MHILKTHYVHFIYIYSYIYFNFPSMTAGKDKKGKGKKKKKKSLRSPPYLRHVPAPVVFGDFVTP
jgi:hypothetical protein